MPVKKFYEVEQLKGGYWRRVGFFKKKVNAKKYLKQFNTGVEVSPLKITEREFLDNNLDTYD